MIQRDEPDTGARQTRASSNVTVKRAPPNVGLVSTETVPAWSATSPDTIARPRPRPTVVAGPRLVEHLAGDLAKQLVIGTPERDFEFVSDHCDRGAEFVGGVRHELHLCEIRCLQPVEHRVHGVREPTDLVACRWSGTRRCRSPPPMSATSERMASTGRSARPITIQVITPMSSSRIGDPSRSERRVVVRTSSTFSRFVPPTIVRGGSSRRSRGRGRGTRRSRAGESASTLSVRRGGASELRPANRADFTEVAWSTYHFVDLLIWPDRMEVRAVDQAVELFDSFTLTP